MILKADQIAVHLQRDVRKIEQGERPKSPLVIRPLHEETISKMKKSGSASVDLRLGNWFSLVKHSKTAILDVVKRKDNSEHESKFISTHYVPFTERFVLHPGAFVLGVTLEWLRFPDDLAGEVIGRSSWGRRGLIIATATGVHPGFTGSLTLEITNLGTIPIAIYPGMNICQLFVMQAIGGNDATHKSKFNLCRKPKLGVIRHDEIAIALATDSK